MPFLANATTSVPALPGAQDPVALALIGVGVVGLLYLFFLRPRAKKAHRAPAPKADPAAERSAERRMQSLVLELEELARTMGGQLDTKSAKLERLIADADERIERLEAARSRAVPVVDAGPRASESGLAALDRHADIYALADAGKRPAEIAAKVNRPAGEVELILALRRG